MINRIRFGWVSWFTGDFNCWFMAYFGCNLTQISAMRMARTSRIPEGKGIGNQDFSMVSSPLFIVKITIVQRKTSIWSEIPVSVNNLSSSARQLLKPVDLHVDGSVMFDGCEVAPIQHPIWM